MIESKKKPCKDCDSDKKPLDKQLEKLKKKTMETLRKSFKLKTNKGCLEAVKRLVELNCEMILRLTETEYFLNLLMHLDRETLKEAEEKPEYVS